MIRSAAAALAHVVALTLLPASPLAAEAPREAPWPTKEWGRAEPASQGIDPAPLSELVALIRKGSRYPEIHSLLVVRNGWLVLEEYFDGYTSERLHTQQSVSKSVTSALIGIAIAQGKIPGVSSKILDFFPEEKSRYASDARKNAITVEHLLTMRTGTDFHESPYQGSPLDRMNSQSRDWLRFYLDSKMVRDPGTAFRYDSGGVILLGGILRKTTGLHADAFAVKHLFQPLGIRKHDWYKASDGEVHTGGGLDLTPPDMARFGLLYLRGGRWEGHQVVPRAWIEDSFRNRADATRRGSSRKTGYGYLWWILPMDPGGEPGGIYAAMGHMGQYIFVIPDRDLVVTVTAGTRGYSDQIKPIEFLRSHILPAVSRK